MRVRWYGQSAFALSAEGRTVFIDPFGALPARPGAPALRFYPPVGGVAADLLLVTHEHADHNAVDQIAGQPQVLRSTAGTFSTPLGTVVAVASEHDAQAGTRRGPNTIFCLEFGGLRICHFGDFGQEGLRPAQARAIGAVDVLFVPVGGGPTIGGAAAWAIGRQLQARIVVPMHYRTAAIDFLEPLDAFLACAPGAVRLPEAAFEMAAPDAGPVALVPAPPSA